MTTEFEPLIAGDRRLLFEFPERSDLGNIDIKYAQGELVARITYHDEVPPDNEFWIKFRFPTAYKYHHQSHCDEFHVDHSIDQLVELTQSAWRDEVESWATESAVLRHFLFFAEDHGALEVLAENYETGGRHPRPPQYQTGP
jgi:hypothetical protein